MSMFENNQYRWRETYFVFFDSSRRPSLKKLRTRLASMNQRFSFANPLADEEGRFESITVLAPDDFAALDVCHLTGEEVAEQTQQLYQDMKDSLKGAERARLEEMLRCDSRFDVLHFEQVGGFDEDDEEELDDMIDPGALLIVLDALAELTGGIAVDPQSGALL